MSRRRQAILALNAAYAYFRSTPRPALRKPEAAATELEQMYAYFD